MNSRRQFLRRVGGAAVPMGLFPDPFSSGSAPYPSPPTIPESVRNRIGWVPTEPNPEQTMKEGAKWSISTYQWQWLRDKVREETNGTVDIPLGGLIAFHIGDTADWITEGGKFLSPTWAKMELDEPIKRHVISYFQSFSVSGFNTEGNVPWHLNPILPVPAGVYADKCLPSSTLTTEMVGDVPLHQFNLEYRLTSSTASGSESVALNSEATLDFLGWLAGWSHEQRIFAVGAVHPRGTGDFCGLDNPHIEEALTKAMGSEVNLNLDNSLYGLVHTVMRSIQ